MTSHSAELALDNDRGFSPNQPFFEWVRGRTALFIGQIVAVLSSVSFMAALIFHTTEAGKSFPTNPHQITILVDYMHVGFIAIFILVLIHFLDDNSRGAYRVGLVYQRVFNPEGAAEADLVETEKQLRKFKQYFLAFWCLMLALYVTFSIEHTLQVPPPSGSPSPERLEGIAALSKLFVPFLTFALNNSSLWCIFWCFVLLYLPAYKGPKQRRAEVEVNPALRASLTSKLRRRLFIGSIVIVSALTLSYPFLLLRHPHQQFGIEGYPAAFDALSGTLNALVLALLIARLDSKLIGLPSWLICILYLYSAVQPLFVVFEQTSSNALNAIMTAVLISVFILKIYFFLIIFYTLQTGRMLNYLYCFPRLSQQVIKSEKNRTETSRYLHFLVPLSYVIGIAAFGYFCFSLIGYAALGAQGQFPLSPSGRIIDLFNLLFVGIFISTLHWMRRSVPGKNAAKKVFQTIFNLDDSNSEDFVKFHENSEKEIKKFRIYFLWFWCAVFILYVVFLLEHVILPSKPGPQKPVNGLMCLATIAQLKQCAYVSHPFALTYTFSYLEFVFSSLNLMFAFWCFAVLYMPAHNAKSAKRQGLLIHYSTFVILVLIAAFPLFSFTIQDNFVRLKGYDAVFQGIAGTLSAVSFALLIARLDSKLIGLSSWLIGILLAYSAIQPLSVVLHQHQAFDTIKTSLLSAALGLKISFFLIILYVLESQRILCYLVCFPFLNKRVDSIFENQFEIKIHREALGTFTFSIWKRNILTYLSDVSFGSRKECDDAIKRLRGRVKDERRIIDQRRMKTDRRVEQRRKEEVESRKWRRLNFRRWREDDRRRNVEDRRKHPRPSILFHPAPVEGTYWVAIRDAGTSESICESIPLRSKEDAVELIEESIEKIPFCKYSRV
jgi:hypothetical protein